MNRGSIISCPNGHHLYRLTRDVVRWTLIKAADFECIEDRMPQPVAGEMMKRECAYCNEHWIRKSPNGGETVHFTTGWWPVDPHMDNTAS